MKTLTLLLSLLVVALAYTDLNDDFLMKTMLTDKAKAGKETQEFTACLLDEGPCQGFNAVAKPHLVPIFENGCADCDIVQKRSGIKYLKSLKSDFPDLWRKFEKKYDPDGTKYDNMIKILSVYD